MRSSHSEVLLRKGALKTCSKFPAEHPCRSTISIKLQSNFTEIALRHGCSPVNLLHIFRTPFPRNTSGWLLLKDEFFMTLMELTLDFLFTDLSQHFEIDLVFFALNFFIHGHGCKRWRKAICVVKLKAIQPQRKYKTRNFWNLIRKRLLRDIHSNMLLSLNFSGTSDTMRDLKTFRIVSNEMPVLLLILYDILVVCKCIQRNFSCLLLWANIFWNLCSKGKHRSVFWEIIAYEQY